MEIEVKDFEARISAGLQGFQRDEPLQPADTVLCGPVWERIRSALAAVRKGWTRQDVKPYKTLHYV
jgi:hypothetical protein